MIDTAFISIANVPKAPDRAKMAVAVVKNSVASGRFRVINGTLPTKTISTSKPALIKLYLSNNFLMVPAT
ncbi:hypothetical protein QUB37_24665 [Microcoleus sp. AT3-A2]|uniref:hypothetical protein n=1 Tax=Microcoleus sp. AT3-A2 TaxID=2818610 RepID=UPI002FD0A5C3